MKKITIIIVFLISTCTVYSQQGWYTLNSGTNANFNSVYFNNSNTGYAAGDSGRIAMTNNGGISWSSHTFNLNFYFSSLTFTDQYNGYICGDSSYVSGIILKTTNAGINWAVVYRTQSLLNTIYFINSSTGYSGGSLGTILKTTDSGISWVTLNSGSLYPIQSVYFSGQNTGFAVGGLLDFQGMIIKTGNGGINWSTQFTTSAPILSVYFLNDNTGYAAGGDYGFGITLFKTTNSGNNWSLICSSVFGILRSLHFTSADTAFCEGINFSDICKTTNGGYNWITQSTGYNVHDLFMLNSLTGYAVGTNGLILKTTTGGYVSIDTVSGVVRYQDNNQPVSSGYVKALALDKITYQVITIDSTPIQSNGTYSLIHVRQDSTYIMAYADDVDAPIFVPTYYDTTIYWRNAHVIYPTGNMSNIDIHVFRANPLSGPLHLGGGVFTNQTSLVGLPNSIIYAKSGNQFRGYSISGSTGIYRIDSLMQESYDVICDRLGYNGGTKNVSLSSANQDTVNFYLINIIGVEKINQNILESFKLYQNYPNPFNPVTTIKFDLPKTTDVQLTIYDLLGREVIKLVDDKLNPGTYNIEWNASGFASGVYFYKLMANDFVETKKLVLIK